MMKKIGAALGALIFFAMLVPAGAQFADQATAIQSVAGINTITGQLPNMSGYPDVLNVLVKLTPANGNTGATTINLNTLGAIAVDKPTLGGLVPLTGTEFVAGQPAILMYNGTVFVLLSVSSTTVAASNLANSSLSAMGLPINMQINAAASANQLTVSLCAINSGSNTCNNPSATSPLLISFRDTTAANGDPVIISQQAALSFTALSTSSFGCITATTCRLWILGINNGGSLALCLFNALLGTTVAPINEAANQTSQSGTTGGTSAQLYYCSASAVTGKAIRILGYVEATWVSGTGWSTTPSLVQVFGPGIKKPGDIVQEQSGTTSLSTSCNSANLATNLMASITPTSAANVIEADADYILGQTTTTASLQNLRMSRGSTPTYFGSEANFQWAGASSTIINSGHVTGIDVPNTTNATVYTLYCVNNGAALFNSPTNPLYIKLKEIMSLLEPANDDLPLRMVG